MAEAPRVYPERSLIRMFLSGYEESEWKDAALNWIEETEENAVEVIAAKADGSPLALEHTLVELFADEKYGSTIFREAKALQGFHPIELTESGLSGSFHPSSANTLASRYLNQNVHRGHVRCAGHLFSAVVQTSSR